MYILKDYQEKATQELTEKSIEAIDASRSQVSVLLEAPTGSGKTVIMAAVLERILEELSLRPGMSDNVAFIWFAPNTLHIQSYHSLKYLYSDTKILNCIHLDHLGNNPSLKPKDLLFVNWSSVSSQKNIWRKDNETNTNLETLIDNTRLNNTKIVLIIDEAHLSAFTGTQAVKVRRLINADAEILVTATAQNLQSTNYKVFIPRDIVVKEGVIKKGVRLNIGLDPEEQNGENVNLHLLRNALAKREELKRMYDQEVGPGVINPLLVIQLPSENASLSAEDKKIRDLVTNLLEVEFGISTDNGRLAIWLSGERDKDGLEESNGLQDVLLFKQAIAQGWDCPRATVMVSYRKVGSATFGIQTVGRILRMPERKHYNEDALNYGYVYTNIQSTQINLIPDDADYFSLKIATRKNTTNWVYDKISRGVIKNDRPAKGILTTKFQEHFFSRMEDQYGLNMLEEIDLFEENSFDSNNTIRAQNRSAMEQKGWSFDFDHNLIEIPVDVELDTVNTGTLTFVPDQLKRFSYSNWEYIVMFDRFCYDNITRLNRSKSWKKLSDTLLLFAEYYLGEFESTAKKLFLYPSNKELLEQDIAYALEEFDLWQKELGNIHRRLEYENWEIPPIRYYNENYNEKTAVNFVLDPYFEYNRSSSPEIKFIALLKQNLSDIDYWYKNGDSGSEHFAIPYKKESVNSESQPSLFYVDFIIKFRSGKIGLFDTKSGNSDQYAVEKHNAIIEYIEYQNKINSELEFTGGIIMEDVSRPGHWRFSKNRISNTHDLTGWEFFNPDEINRN